MHRPPHHAVVFLCSHHFSLALFDFFKKYVDILKQSVYNNKSRLNIVCTISSVGRAPDS